MKYYVVCCISLFKIMKGNVYSKGIKYLNIKCEEQFVHQPATLKSIASAYILDKDLLKFDIFNLKFFKKIATDPVEIVTKEYMRGSYYIFRRVDFANNHTYSIDIVHCYPFSSFSTSVPLSQVNDNAKIERRERVKRQLLPYFESRKTRIRYEE